MQVIIRPITPADNPAVAALIRGVMPEFGAVGPGYAINDPEVDDMFNAYDRLRARYLVLEEQGLVVGGGGFAPLKGGDDDTCEIQKMYFLASIRGRGFGTRLLTKLLGEAQRLGFKHCYLETLEGMVAAQALYVKQGFKALCGPLGKTGHHSCNRWYVRAF